MYISSPVQFFETLSNQFDCIKRALCNESCIFHNRKGHFLAFMQFVCSPGKDFLSEAGKLTAVGRLKLNLLALEKKAIFLL